MRRRNIVVGAGEVALMRPRLLHGQVPSCAVSSTGRLGSCGCPGRPAVWRQRCGMLGEGIGTAVCAPVHREASVAVGIVAADEHVGEGFFGDGFGLVFDDFLGSLADELVEGVHVAAGAFVELFLEVQQ